jgi:hypothetical protein
LFTGDIQELQLFIDEFSEPIESEEPENTEKQSSAYVMELPIDL